MTIERDFLVRFLEKTRDRSIDVETLRESFRITPDVFDSLLDALASDGLLQLEDGEITASLHQRLGVAVRAIRAGADFERVGRALGWLEFEEMVAYTFQENGYDVRERFRFVAEGRRWEIDVLAVRKPMVVCVECKRWGRGLGDGTARRIVEAHLGKTEVLSEAASGMVDRLRVGGWGRAVFVPVILTLQPVRGRVYRRAPVVSVFELPGFLSEFEGELGWLAGFDVSLS